MKLYKCNLICIISDSQGGRKNDTEGKVSDKFQLLIFDLMFVPGEEVIMCSQNWISLSIQRWKS